MRLTIRSELALRTLMCCAANPGSILRKRDVATSIGASENHLAQVIYRLGQRGFLHTFRGRAGGLKLARPTTEISIGDVLRRFEHEVPLVPCLETSHSDCRLSAACRLKCLLTGAEEAFYAKLDGTSLADLMSGNTVMQSLLAIA